MDRLRLPSGRIIWVKDIDPANPPQDGTCPNCPAVGVHFRSASEARRGAQVYTPATIAANPGHADKHRLDCEYRPDPDREYTARESLSHAVRSGRFVLLNLNFIGRARRRSRQGWKEKESTPYAQWCRDNSGRYAAISVKSAEDIRGVEEKIVKQGGPEALERVMVGFKGAIIPYSRFNIGADAGRMAALYNHVSRLPPNNKGFSQSAMPYMLQFNVRSKGSGKFIPGRSFFLARKNGRVLQGSPRLYLIAANDAGVDDKEELAAQICSAGTVVVVAQPWIGQEIARKNRREFSDSAAGSTITPFCFSVFRARQLALPAQDIVRPAPAAEQDNVPPGRRRPSSGRWRGVPHSNANGSSGLSQPNLFDID